MARLKLLSLVLVFGLSVVGCNKSAEKPDLSGKPDVMDQESIQQEPTEQTPIQQQVDYDSKKPKSKD